MHNDELIKDKTFTRRSLIAGFGKLTLMAILTGRMYYLQLIKSEEYKTLSENNRIRVSLIPAERGSIVDRNNQLLARNENYYRIILDKLQTNDVQLTLQNLFSILSLDQESQQEIIEKVKKSKYSDQVLILNKLTWSETASIEVNAYDLPGINIDVGQIRNYLYGENSAHILGYVGPPTKLETNHNFINHPGITIGKTGIEKYYNYLLIGKPGIRKKEVNAYGTVIRELNKQPPIPGKQTCLTIDINLQNFVAKSLPSIGASAVVMDINNGEILALHSTPSFDPNQFSPSISAEYWQQLMQDKNFPLSNKVISAQYPPGSIFKLMTALAALEAAVPPDLTVHCPGYIWLGNRKFHCWKDTGHGLVKNIVEAITHSCNCYFFTLALKIGVDKFADMAFKFGFGEETSIDLPGEVKGTIPNKKWKKQKLGKDWQVGDTLNSCIGQGYMLATPIQLAVMVARIANMGKKVLPTLMKKNQDFMRIDVQNKNLQLIKNGMNNSVNTPYGTGYINRIIDTDMAMAGKTGTSQVRSKKNNEDLSKSSVKREHRNHGLFAGFAPVYNPRYAICVVVEHGGAGGSAAEPLARDTLIHAQELKI